MIGPHGVVAALLLLAGSGALAQSVQYTIGIGDELQVTVWQRQDLSTRVAVEPDGSISLPLLGSIRAAGQTPARLGEDLTRRFSFLDREVSVVTVTVVAYKSQRVFVLGRVVRPEAYSYPRMPGVWDVIRDAGGPLPDAALMRVRIVPPEGGGPPIIVDLEKVLASGEFGSLPVLQPGSTIIVPQLEAAGPEGEFVHVSGQVRTPGTFSIDAARTVLQAVLAAGGPTEVANLSVVRVVRPGPVRARVFEVDLNDYLEEGVLYANLPLIPGDAVSVPRNERRFLLGSLRQAARFARDVVGTIFFFTRLGDDENKDDVTISVESGVAEP